MAQFGSDYREIVYRHKDVDEDTASDTTLNNDADCIVPAVTTEHLMIRGTAFFTYGGGGLKLALSGPTFSALHYGIILVTNGSTAAEQIATAWDTTINVSGGGGANGMAIIQGYVILTGSGNIVLRWAQNTSNATNTTLHAGTYLETIRVD